MQKAVLDYRLTATELCETKGFQYKVPKLIPLEEAYNINNPKDFLIFEK